MNGLRSELTTSDKVAAEGLLIRLIRFPEERAILAAIVSPDTFAEDQETHRRLYSLVMGAPGGELQPIALTLYEILLDRSDFAAADLLVDLGSSDIFPCCLTETIQLGLHIRDNIRDKAKFLADCRLEKDARGLLTCKNCEREEIPVEPDEELEW